MTDKDKEDFGIALAKLDADITAAQNLKNRFKEAYVAEHREYENGELATLLRKRTGASYGIPVSIKGALVTTKGDITYTYSYIGTNGTPEGEYHYMYSGETLTKKASE